jgi:hypothetical protein
MQLNSAPLSSIRFKCGGLPLRGMGFYFHTREK